MTASLNFTMRHTMSPAMLRAKAATARENRARSARNEASAPHPFAGLIGASTRPPRWHGSATVRRIETDADGKPADPLTPRTGRPRKAAPPPTPAPVPREPIARRQPSAGPMVFKNASARRAALVQLLREMSATAADLAADLGVSERTIYRDVASLQKRGARIVGQAGLGYRIGGDHGR